VQAICLQQSTAILPAIATLTCANCKDESMKPFVMITQTVAPAAIEMLTSICAILPRVSVSGGGTSQDDDLLQVASRADALLMASPERIDAALLRRFPRLRVVACAYRQPQAVDFHACTNRGIWITNIATRQNGDAAEIEAARNILDVLGGDIPRGAMNDVFLPAA
jgi:phosphoglycerate dehydrogenase-like enzyme